MYNIIWAQEQYTTSTSIHINERKITAKAYSLPFKMKLYQRWEMEKLGDFVIVDGKRELSKQHTSKETTKKKESKKKHFECLSSKY